MSTTLTERPAPSAEATKLDLDLWWLVAIGSVIVSVTLASIFAPDLVSGSAQEHLPLAALTSWLWGAAAIGYIAFVGPGRATPSMALSVAVLWFAVAATSIAVPDFVTGSDPTRIPLAAMIAPVVGTIVTGFLCLHTAARST